MEVRLQTNLESNLESMFADLIKQLVRSIKDSQDNANSFSAPSRVPDGGPEVGSAEGRVGRDKMRRSLCAASLPLGEALESTEDPPTNPHTVISNTHNVSSFNNVSASSSNAQLDRNDKEHKCLWKCYSYSCQLYDKNRKKDELGDML